MTRSGRWLEAKRNQRPIQWLNMEILIPEDSLRMEVSSVCQSVISYEMDPLDIHVKHEMTRVNETSKMMSIQVNTCLTRHWLPRESRPRDPLPLSYRWEEIPPLSPLYFAPRASGYCSFFPPSFFFLSCLVDTLIIRVASPSPLPFPMSTNYWLIVAHPSPLFFRSQCRMVPSPSHHTVFQWYRSAGVPSLVSDSAFC